MHSIKLFRLDKLLSNFLFFVICILLQLPYWFKESMHFLLARVESHLFPLRILQSRASHHGFVRHFGHQVSLTCQRYGTFLTTVPIPSNGTHNKTCSLIVVILTAMHPNRLPFTALHLPIDERSICSQTSNGRFRARFAENEWRSW